MSRQLSGLDLGTLELFCLVAERGGFAAAANAAGLTAPAVTRAIARLEQRLGARLFIRTTRHVRLSEAGHSYYTQCKAATVQLQEAEQSIVGQRNNPAGSIRLSLPTSIGHVRILPKLARFRERYPEITFDVQLSNRNVDFATEDIDLAIRGRIQPDSSLVVRLLEEAPLVTVASPSYLECTGTPSTPAELTRHSCIGFVLPRTGLIVPWTYRVGDDFEEHLPHACFVCRDDILGPVTLARADAGITQTYRYLVENDLHSGALNEVLTQYAGASRPFSLVYPANRHLPHRVRLLIDDLLASKAGSRHE